MLLKLIQQKILDNNGTISFADFMKIALYTPELGYYQKINFGEDFITAPLISDLFSKTLANSLLNNSQSKPPAQILEFGAGNGQMAADILLFLQSKNALPKVYYIVEISDKLKQQQADILQKSVPDLYQKIKWLDEMPEQFNGVVLLNEVMDAIPAERFIIKNQTPYALNVGLDESGNLINVIGKKITIKITFDNHPDGFISEYNPQAINFLQQIVNKLQTGLITIIDYGYESFEYYHPNRDLGTLTCFYHHQNNNNPFIYLGEQDISVHSNFTDFANLAQHNNLSINFYGTQATFLLQNGIASLAETYDLNHTETRLRVSQAIQKLTLPAQMGEVVKVLILEKL